MKIKIKKCSDKIGTEIPLPSYATVGSAGLDLRACIDEEILVAPGQRVKVPTGIAIQIGDANIVGLIFARSGNAWKHGITLTNAVGVIDSDYIGEIQVLLTNTDEANPFIIRKGDRIAQLVFMPVYQADLEVVEELEATERGTGGFGSTGIK